LAIRSTFCENKFENAVDKDAITNCKENFCYYCCSEEIDENNEVKFGNCRK